MKPTPTRRDGCFVDSKIFYTINMFTITILYHAANLLIRFLKIPHPANCPGVHMFMNNVLLFLKKSKNYVVWRGKSVSRDFLTWYFSGGQDFFRRSWDMVSVRAFTGKMKSFFSPIEAQKLTVLLLYSRMNKAFGRRG